MRNHRVDNAIYSEELNGCQLAVLSSRNSSSQNIDSLIEPHVNLLCSVDNKDIMCAVCLYNKIHEDRKCTIIYLFLEQLFNDLTHFSDKNMFLLQIMRVMFLNRYVKEVIVHFNVESNPDVSDIISRLNLDERLNQQILYSLKLAFPRELHISEICKTISSVSTDTFVQWHLQRLLRNNIIRCTFKSDHYVISIIPADSFASTEVIPEEIAALPNIAIVTTRLVAKNHLDEMLSEKIYFYKHHKGEAYAYTIGKMQCGLWILTSKLSAFIDDEDTIVNLQSPSCASITSLLSTFHKIEHVIQIGIGKPVDFKGCKALLGDVVVSVPVNPSGYIFAKGFTELASTWPAPRQNILYKLSEFISKDQNLPVSIDINRPKYEFLPNVPRDILAYQPFKRAIRIFADGPIGSISRQLAQSLRFSCIDSNQDELTDKILNSLMQVDWQSYLLVRGIGINIDQSLQCSTASNEWVSYSMRNACKTLEYLINCLRYNKSTLYMVNKQPKEVCTKRHSVIENNAVGVHGAETCWLFASVSIMCIFSLINTTGILVLSRMVSLTEPLISILKFNRSVFMKTPSLDGTLMVDNIVMNGINTIVADTQINLSTDQINVRLSKDEIWIKGIVENIEVNDNVKLRLWSTKKTERDRNKIIKQMQITDKVQSSRISSHEMLTINAPCLTVSNFSSIELNSGQLFNATTKALRIESKELTIDSKDIKIKMVDEMRYNPVQHHDNTCRLCICSSNSKLIPIGSSKNCADLLQYNIGDLCQ
ncbi:hypothetical protein GJ496_006689 [Pomphorhynchus laevis]|nr:hypothetical protein GJ496_006689 [Pomphorhynchus laevis]